jgi:hypothetical protein
LKKGLWLASAVCAPASRQASARIDAQNNKSARRRINLT